MLVLLYFQYVWTAFSIIFIGCFLRLFSERDLIKSFLRKYFIRFYQIIILSLSYLLSLHLINKWFGIETLYLTNAPWLMAFFFSIFLFLALMSILNVIYTIFNVMINFFKWFISEDSINKIKAMPIVRLSDKSMDLAIISIPLCILVANYSNEIVYTALRLDAYSASDCGEQKYSSVYIRKNSQECYVFTSWFSTDAPELIQSIKK